MAIKTKVNEILGNLISKKDVTGILTETTIKDKPVFKIAEDAKLGITPGITVAQSILQKTGIKNNIKNYSDSLNSLLTNYLANNLSIPSTKSGQLEDALQVTLDESKSYTSVSIKNDGKETFIYISKDGDYIEVAQNISDERYAQYVLSSTTKEQPIEEALLIQLHDDGNMNVANHITTVQKTESLNGPDGKPTGEHVCSVKSSSKAYIQRANGEQLFIPDSQVASSEINFNENTSTVKGVASRISDVYNVIDNSKGLANKNFENIEKIYYLQTYSSTLPDQNTQFVKEVQDTILSDRAIVDSRYNCYSTSQYPTITSSSTTEEMKDKANYLASRYRAKYREYQSDPKEILKNNTDKPTHFKLKQEAIDALRNSEHADEVLRALLDNPTKQANIQAKELFGTLLQGYTSKDTNVVVSVFDGRYSSFSATITSPDKDSSSIQVSPKKYAYSIEKTKGKFGQDELSFSRAYTSQTINTSNLTADTYEPYGTICKPPVDTINSKYTVTEIRNLSKGYNDHSLEVGLPTSVRHTSSKEVGVYKDLSNHYFQVIDNPYVCFVDTQETKFNQESGEVTIEENTTFINENGISNQDELKVTNVDNVKFQQSQPGEFVIAKVQDCTQDDGINQ